jgi:hypothetical protein
MIRRPADHLTIAAINHVRGDVSGKATAALTESDAAASLELWREIFGDEFDRMTFSARTCDVKLAREPVVTGWVR